MDFVAVMVLAGGLVSGLSGFGAGLAALPLWLVELPPALAAPLVAACSVESLLATLRAIRHPLDWRRVPPFVVGARAHEQVPDIDRRLQVGREPDGVGQWRDEIGVVLRRGGRLDSETGLDAELLREGRAGMTRRGAHSMRLCRRIAAAS